MSAGSIAVLLLPLAILLTADADSAILYEQRFSSAPGWVTNDPANLHWDSVNGTFHGWQANSNTSYAWSAVSWDGLTSFDLYWDYNVASVQWSAGLTFGLWDDQHLHGTYSNMLAGDASLVDPGRDIALVGNGVGAGVGEGGLVVRWSTGQWYSAHMRYDATTSTVTMSVVNRDTGVQLGHDLMRRSAGPFDPSMHYLGVSREFMEGYTSSSIEYQIDNVLMTIDTPVPEPAPVTALSVGLGQREPRHVVRPLRLRRRSQGGQ